MDGEVNDFNKEKKYNKKFKDVEKKLKNRTKDSNDIILYNHYLNYLKRILFSTKKSSRKGLTISALPILLSKIYTNNSSKEITNEIKQLTKKLYDNKQITKQLYNILNKALRQDPQHLLRMIRKEQSKILDDKIESNNNQYKVDRLNTEISAF